MGRVLGEQAEVGGMKAAGVWKGGFETQLEDGRGHRVTVDLDRDEGGTDAGTSALELSVLSLAGCVTTIFAIVARKRKLRFEAMRVELEAARPRGSPTIASVEGTLRVMTSAPEEEVETVLAITLRTCPLGVLFEQAHIPVQVHALVEHPPHEVPPMLST